MRTTVTGLLGAALAGACSGTTGPGSLCNEREGIEICIDRNEYTPGARVPLTLLNQRSEAVFEDMCSGRLVGRTSASRPWSDRLGSVRRCEPEGSPEVVAANMRAIEPGATLADTFGIPVVAFQGQWRVELHFLDAEAAPLADRPFTSPTFLVVRTAAD